MIVNSLLLGGWRDVLDDVRRLESGLRALPGVCTCGQGSAHLAGRCACCEHGERRGCTDCEAVMETLRGKIDDLVDASLRFLPAVESMLLNDGSGDAVALVHGVRHKVQQVDLIFRQISTAAARYRDGCAASQLSDLKTSASALVGLTQTTADSLAALLSRNSPPSTNARGLQ